MTRRKKIIRTVQVLLIAGMLIFGFYPKVSDAWNRYVADQQIQSYETAVAQNADTEELGKAFQAAQDYNAALYASGTNHIAEYTARIEGIDEDGNLIGTDDSEDGSDNLAVGKADDEEYESLLNITSDGLMGSLEIDKINVRLPVYHDSTDEVLAKGIGHLYGSSLPVGGDNTHAVLTGHRGLPTMELFTNLDKMEEGDTFTLQILGQTLTYQVSRVDVILPEELDGLSIEPGEDLVSLVTCTPYGVNTHRLVVTGKRIENPPEAPRTVLTAAKDAVQAPTFIMILAAAILIAMAVFLIWVWARKTLPEGTVPAKGRKKAKKEKPGPGKTNETAADKRQKDMRRRHQVTNSKRASQAPPRDRRNHDSKSGVLFDEYEDPNDLGEEFLDEEDRETSTISATESEIAKVNSDMARLQNRYKRLAQQLKELQQQKVENESDSIMDAYIKSGMTYDEIMKFLRHDTK